MKKRTTKQKKSTKSAVADETIGKEDVKKSDQPYIGLIDEAPEWDTEGYYILTGWRINFNTYGRVLRSFFMIHNETVNIWSHFIGAMFFVFLVGYVIINMPPSTNLEEAGLG